MPNRRIDAQERAKRDAFPPWIKAWAAAENKSLTEIARGVGARPGDLQSRVRLAGALPPYLPAIEKLVGQTFPGASAAPPPAPAPTSKAPVDVAPLADALRKAIAANNGVPPAAVAVYFEFRF